MYLFLQELNVHFGEGNDRVKTGGKSIVECVVMRASA